MLHINKSNIIYTCLGQTYSEINNKTLIYSHCTSFTSELILTKAKPCIVNRNQTITCFVHIPHSFSH